MKEEIVKIKKENPEMGYKKIASLVGCSHNTVKYHLSESVRKYFAIRRQANRRKAKTDIKEKFGGKCSICGYGKCLDALQFHHLDPKKKHGKVMEILTRLSKEKGLKEAEKCQLICANCHAEIHAID